MEIPKTYNPSEAESKWYPYWKDNHFFRSVPDHRTPYTIVIPPPNVTGVLHMGHMLNNTIQDVLIRRARMMGFNACWVPGTDHASIATEAKVVKLLADKGIKKADLSREEFLKHAWDWKEKYGGIILQQLEKLGASCDWERTRFTMDPALTDAVTDVFIDLYNKGHIYRGVRMVNWDPQGLTAVSDEEVIYKESNSKLVYVKYMIEGEDNYIAVATTRPETIMGDTAVCVHPEDERYKHLKGKYCFVPVVNRRVPIIFDEYIDREFGTGALKVTPAHDINDFNLGQKHKLPVIDALNPDGTISEAAGAYVGMDRFACRKQIIKDLQENNLVVKIEEIKNKVGHSERTDAVIEPKLSMQWFLKMEEVSKPALDAVMSGDVKLIPEKFINTYRHWMENVRDWCISRQLWWGQRIPAWYDGKGNTVVCRTPDEAFEKMKTLNAEVKKEDIHQDTDVVDTWFSSWLWPLTVFDADVVKKGWENANADLKYYYPTNDLVTAPEILFFWVARMIIAGKEYTGKKPFTNVYLTGIVRDKLGRKMSKSLGNSPDPLDLIAKYGADGVRVGMLLSSPAGNDLLFDESYCEQGRNFANKVWNAYRLIKGFEISSAIEQPQSSKLAIIWFENKLSEQLAVINEHYDKYRMSDALMATYKLVWDDFCAWFLEAIKPDFINGKSLPIDEVTYQAAVNFFESLLKIMHPWMPFITEELWHYIDENRDGGDCIIVANWPVITNKAQSNIKGKLRREFEHEISFEKALNDFEKVREGITFIRNCKNNNKLNDPQIIVLCLMDEELSFQYWKPLTEKLSKADIKINPEKGLMTQGAKAYKMKLSGSMDFYFETELEDKGALEKELARLNGFVEGIRKKLANEKFVANAKPEVIAVERKKENDALSKIKALEEQLASL